MCSILLWTKYSISPSYVFQQLSSTVASKKNYMLHTKLKKAQTLDGSEVSKNFSFSTLD